MGKTFKKRVQGGGVGGRGGGARQHVSAAAAPAAAAALRDAEDEEESEDEEGGDGLAPLGRRTRNAALQARPCAGAAQPPRPNQCQCAHR